ncbi:hypothetical protein KM043_001858 [Ampulex compressa]|nr:hypothetical protein KM043_001858 [Ampulex compressa]
MRAEKRFRPARTIPKSIQTGTVWDFPRWRFGHHDRSGVPSENDRGFHAARYPGRSNLFGLRDVPAAGLAAGGTRVADSSPRDPSERFRDVCGSAASRTARLAGQAEKSVHNAGPPLSSAKGKAGKQKEGANRIENSRPVSGSSSASHERHVAHELHGQIAERRTDSPRSGLFPLF